MPEVHAVYAYPHLTEPDVFYYVGSSINVRNRDKSHKSPKNKTHGPFGRMIHKEGIADDIQMRILEIVKQDGTRDELKSELKRLEYLWQEKLNPRFGMMDGLNKQPYEVQMERRQFTRKRWKDANPDKKYIRKPMTKAQYEKKKTRLATPEGRRRHNAYMKEYHRQKVLAAGREYKPRRHKRPRRVLSIAQLVKHSIGFT